MNVDKGYVDAPIDASLDLRSEILRLKQEHNAVIMAHYYQRQEIQELADYIGDSLALAQLAAKTDAEVIVLCGVHFMGETAKILCPQKTVIVPDLSARQMPSRLLRVFPRRLKLSLDPIATWATI